MPRKHLPAFDIRTGDVYVSVRGEERPVTKVKQRGREIELSHQGPRQRADRHDMTIVPDDIPCTVKRSK